MPFGLIAAGILLLISVNYLLNDVLTIQIAEKELTRRNTIEGKLDYISRHLEQIEIVQELPETNIRSVQLENRATDVLSASLTFLAMSINHELGSLGMIGKS